MKSEHKLPKGRLKQLREDYPDKLTQSTLANEMKFTEKTYRSWEINNTLPNTGDLIELADFYDVSTDYILGITDYKHVEYEDISNLTGLSEEALQVLKKHSCADVVSAIITQPEFVELATLIKVLLDKEGLDKTNLENHTKGIWSRGIKGEKYYSPDISDSIKYRASTQFSYILDNIYQYWRDNNG